MLFGLVPVQTRRVGRCDRDGFVDRPSARIPIFQWRSWNIKAWWSLSDGRLSGEGASTVVITTWNRQYYSSGCRTNLGASPMALGNGRRD